MRSVAAAFLTFFLCPAFLAGQAIRGIVVEEETGVPIAGVTVQLLSADSVLLATAESGPNGWSTLPSQGKGRFRLRTSHPSYHGDVQPVEVRNRELLTVLLRMGRAAIPLEPLVVTARSTDLAASFRERARHGGQGIYITREQIDKQIANRPSDLLQTIPVLRLEVVWDAAGGTPSQAMLMRSLGELCEPAMFLDGVRVPSTRAEDLGFDVNQLIATDRLEGIEVYRTFISIPPELAAQIPHNLVVRSDAQRTCGAVAFWSRNPPGIPVTLKRLGIAAGVLGAILLLR